MNNKNHWENIYQTKQPNEVSWTQAKPNTSLQFFEEYKVPKTASIIDVGGGDSLLVDNLIELGYTNISVLDISEAALNKAKIRLGNKAKNVNWIVADATNFKPTQQYDFWHDRAAFHFLTTQSEIDNYVEIVKQSVSQNGILVIGTFSEQGPKKCSGIDIKQYSETSMEATLKKYFTKIKCFTTDHITPFNTIQNFIFCSFQKL